MLPLLVVPLLFSVASCVPLSDGTTHAIALGDRLPASDGNLHIYPLPVGQGDSNIIQCPDGTLSIYDLGSRNKKTLGFWRKKEIIKFIDGHFQDIRNIIISHNHFDHLSHLGDVLGKGKDLSGLRNIYVSCTEADLQSTVTKWLDEMNLRDRVRLVNGGFACGMNGVYCGGIDICPNQPSIKAKILAANYGQQCNKTRGNANIDSIVLKLSYHDVSVMLNGDFEDFYPTLNENGPQKAMVNYYGEELHVTVLQISHHGGFYKANKPVMLDALRPKAIMTSGNFEYQYRHPLCATIDHILNEVPLRTVCKPEAKKNSEYYCGEPLYPSIPIENRLQREYTCGNADAEEDDYRVVTDNEYALYTTTPTLTSLNVLTFSTDGFKWGFTKQCIDRPTS